jgi:hypothetical protein
MKSIVESKVKCPKCKGNTLELIEVWKGSTIVWQQQNGTFDRQDGNLEPGDAHKVEARCNNCAYQWTVRKALQISDVINFKS